MESEGGVRGWSQRVESEDSVRGGEGTVRREGEREERGQKVGEDRDRRWREVEYTYAEETG